MTRPRLGLCNLEGGGEPREAARGKVRAFRASTGFEGDKGRFCWETKDPVPLAIHIWKPLPLWCFQTCSLWEENILARRRPWLSPCHTPISHGGGTEGQRRLCLSLPCTHPLNRLASLQ